MTTLGKTMLSLSCFSLFLHEMKKIIAIKGVNEWYFFIVYVLVLIFLNLNKEADHIDLWVNYVDHKRITFPQKNKRTQWWILYNFHWLRLFRIKMRTCFRYYWNDLSYYSFKPFTKIDFRRSCNARVCFTVLKWINIVKKKNMLLVISCWFFVD